MQKLETKKKVKKKEEKKKIILIGRKTERAIYAKVKDL